MNRKNEEKKTIEKKILHISIIASLLDPFLVLPIKFSVTARWNTLNPMRVLIREGRSTLAHTYNWKEMIIEIERGRKIEMGTMINKLIQKKSLSSHNYFCNSSKYVSHKHQLRKFWKVLNNQWFHI